MSEENVIEFPIRAPGAVEAAQAVAGFAISLKKTDSALSEASKASKAASDALGATAAQAKAAKKEQDDLAKSAAKAAEALTKQRDAATELVRVTLSPLTAEQEKLNKQISILSTELARLNNERAGVSVNGAAGVDRQIANTQAAIAKLRSERLAISQASFSGGALAGGGALAAAPGQLIGATATEATRATASLDGMARAGARGFAALNVLGGELVHINPAMATMVQAVGRSSGAMSGFAGIVGGPYALAIGAAVAGIGLWIDHTRRETEEQERLAEAIGKTTKEIQDQIDASEKIARTVLDKRRPDTITRQDQIEQLGLGITNLRGQRSKFDRYDQAFEIQGLDAQIQQKRDAIRKLQQEQKDADFYDAQKKEAQRIDEIGDTIPERAKGDGSTAAGRREFLRETEVGTRLGEQDDTLKKQLDAAKGFQQAQTKLYENGLAAQREVQGRALDDEFARQRKAFELRKLGVEDEVALHKDKEAQIVSLAEYRQAQESKHDAQRKRAVAETTEIGVRAFAAFGSAGIGALMKLAEGQKVSGKAILRSIGETLVGQGQGYLFQGLAETIMGNPHGPGLIGVGTAEVAFGLGLGAASRGASSGSGSGGGSGGVRADSAPGGAVYWDGQRFVRGSPYAPVPSNTNQGGTSNIYVQQTYQSTFAPTRQDAEMLVRATREGLRTATMNPNWASGG